MRYTACMVTLRALRNYLNIGGLDLRRRVKGAGVTLRQHPTRPEWYQRLTDDEVERIIVEHHKRSRAAQGS